jgi:Type II secretion system (T2SS), protein G
MKKYNLKQSVVNVLVGFALLCLCLYCFVFPFLGGGGHAKIPRAQTDEEQLSIGIQSYGQVFGSYPTGENSNVVRMLIGDNPRKMVFLNFRRPAKHPNEMVDPWETPYQIEFSKQTNFIIRSAGKDKIFGDADDIVFNSVSNDFVKP